MRQRNHCKLYKSCKIAFAPGEGQGCQPTLEEYFPEPLSSEIPPFRWAEWALDWAPAEHHHQDVAYSTRSSWSNVILVIESVCSVHLDDNPEEGPLTHWHSQGSLAAFPLPEHSQACGSSTVYLLPLSYINFTGALILTWILCWSYCQKQESY